MQIPFQRLSHGKFTCTILDISVANLVPQLNKFFSQLNSQSDIPKPNPHAREVYLSLYQEAKIIGGRGTFILVWHSSHLTIIINGISRLVVRRAPYLLHRLLWPCIVFILKTPFCFKVVYGLSMIQKPLQGLLEFEYKKT